MKCLPRYIKSLCFRTKSLKPKKDKSLKSRQGDIVNATKMIPIDVNFKSFSHFVTSLIIKGSEINPLTRGGGRWAVEWKNFYDVT